MKNSETKYSPTIYFNSKTKILINDLDIDVSLETSHQTILSKFQKWLALGHGWMIKPVNDDYIDISIYNPLAVNSYLTLPGEWKNPRKDLINIKTKIKNISADAIPTLKSNEQIRNIN